jgi:hypothetical protein
MLRPVPLANILRASLVLIKRAHKKGHRVIPVAAKDRVLG